MSPHGPIVAFLEDAVFDAKLDVAYAEEGGPSPGSHIGIGNEEVKLHVRQDAVIGLEVRGGTEETTFVVFILGCGVELPVLRNPRARGHPCEMAARQGQERCRQLCQEHGDRQNSKKGGWVHPECVPPVDGVRLSSFSP